MLIILAVLLLLFGGPKLPGLARSVGQSMRIFRSEVKTMKQESGDEATTTPDSSDAKPSVADEASAMNTGTAASQGSAAPKS